MKRLSLTFFFLAIFCSCKPKESPAPTTDDKAEFVERTTADLNKPKPPGHLCIFYGFPSLINSAKGDLTVASAEFGKFHLIVLGDGLSKTTHPDYGNTKIIIANLNAKKRIVMGYVDLGVSTNNHSETTLRQQIDGWKTLGASAIFFDDAGYDYKVTRDRQNAVIQYCRQQNMNVCMNAWNPDDVLGGASLMNENDYYLSESYLVGHNNYFDLAAWKKKADLCYNYMKTKGVKILCVATGGENITADFNTTDKFSLAWTGVAGYNFHYFQATNALYSANNNIVHFFPNLSESYGNIFKQADIQKESDTHYFRSTDTHTLHIYGNGSTQGNGKITKL